MRNSIKLTCLTLLVLQLQHQHQLFCDDATTCDDLQVPFKKNIFFYVNNYWRMKKMSPSSLGEVYLGKVTGPIVHFFELMQNCPPIYYTDSQAAYG